MNMLANYLPADDDPTFKNLYDALPAYISGLHSRYPPVCNKCQPAVDDALRKADHKAQNEAWGMALRRGAGLTGDRSHPNPMPGTMAVLLWRLRGVLFCLATALSLTLGAAGKLVYIVRGVGLTKQLGQHRTV